ncbi:MAG: hypothetical protein WBA61_00905 [Aequorivita sp.]
MAQNTSDQQVFQQYDQLVSLENTSLYNGTEFNDLFLNTDGTYRYFKGFDYAKGSVTYSGQFYANVPLKYDVLDDNLLTHSEDNLSIFIVRLIPEFIDSFTIHNSEFVRLTDVNRGVVGNDFYEKAFIGNNLKLYIKHIKKKLDKALKSGIQYKFSEANFFLIEYRNEYFIANSAKDVWKNIPEFNDQIRDFNKTYRQLYKTDKQVFMTKLIGYLDGLLNLGVEH